EIARQTTCIEFQGARLLVEKHLHRTALSILRKRRRPPAAKAEVAAHFRPYESFGTFKLSFGAMPVKPTPEALARVRCADHTLHRGHRFTKDFIPRLGQNS